MKKVLLAALAVMAFVSLQNCSGSGSAAGAGNTAASGDVSAGTGTGDAAVDTQSAFSGAFTVTQTALQTALAGSGAGAALVKSAPVFTAVEVLEQSCGTSGTYDMIGDFDNTTPGLYTYDFNLAYNDCNGLNGSFDLSGSYTYTSTLVNYDSTVDGSVGGFGCVVSFDAFSYEFDYDVNTSSFTGFYNGSYTSDCDGSEVSCTFDNVSITDAAAYLNSCTVDGQALSSGSTGTGAGNAAPFFLAEAGTFTALAVDVFTEGNETPTTDTTFTHGQTYTVTVTADGVITYQTNGADVVFTYGDDGADFYETYAHESYVGMTRNGVAAFFQVQYDFGKFFTYEDDVTFPTPMAFFWRLDVQ